MKKTVKVELGKRSYDILIGAGMMDELAQAVAASGAKQAVVISETNVDPLFGESVENAIRSAGLDCWRTTPFPAGEPSKTLTTVSMLLDELLTHTPAIDRKTLVIPLGGGVAGDMAGFVAAIALRGLKFLQVPTSLLADVDSSVGGKTGVDHSAGKNLIGAFHQPGGVIIDVEMLRTLPLAELRNGLGECVKHGVIRDPSLLDFIEANSANLLAEEDYDGSKKLAFDSDIMVELISRNVAIKAAVVSEDEREAGTRAHLNFGHTIGHALETFIGYENIRHGEAVSLGIIAANHIAVSRKMLAEEQAERIRKILSDLQLPTTSQPVDSSEVWRIMQHDKKNQAGKVRMVLPTEPGKVDIFDNITEIEVIKAVQALET